MAAQEVRLTIPVDAPMPVNIGDDLLRRLCDRFELSPTAREVWELLRGKLTAPATLLVVENVGARRRWIFDASCTPFAVPQGRVTRRAEKIMG